MARELKASLRINVKTDAERELKKAEKAAAKLERWVIRTQRTSAAWANKAADAQVRASARATRAVRGAADDQARAAERSAARQARAAQMAAKAEVRAAAQRAAAAARLDKWRIGVQLRSAQMANRGAGGGGRGKGDSGGGGGFGAGFMALGKVSMIGYALSAAFRAVGASVAYALGPIIDFQSAMAQVRIKGGFDEATTARLGEHAMQMGRTSAFSPTQAAEAQVALAASDLDEDQIAANMPTVLKFAQASGMGTGESADYLVNVAKQFAMDLKDPNTLRKVGATLKNAADASTIGERDLQQTLKYSGPIAHQAGYGIGEAAAMAAIMGNSGLKGSQAGSGLRNLFSSFAKPKGGKLTGELLESMGLTKKDVNEGMKDIPSFLELMEARMQSKGFEKSKRIALAASLFGQYGMTAAMVLQEAAKGVPGANPNASVIVNGITKMVGGVNGSENSLDTAAAIKAATLQGKLDKLAARWDTFKTALGAKLEPHIGEGLDMIIAKVEEWEKRSGSSNEVAQWLNDMGSAAKDALVVLDALAWSITKLIEGYTILKHTAQTVGGWFEEADTERERQTGDGKGADYNASPEMTEMRNRILLEQNPNDLSNPLHPINVRKRARGDAFAKDLPGMSSDPNDPANLMSVAPEPVNTVVDINISMPPGTKGGVTNIKKGTTEARVTLSSEP